MIVGSVEGPLVAIAATFSYLDKHTAWPTAIACGLSFGALFGLGLCGGWWLNLSRWNRAADDAEHGRIGPRNFWVSTHVAFLGFFSGLLALGTLAMIVGLLIEMLAGPKPLP